MIRLAIAGAGGRMGRMLLDAAAREAGVTVVSAFEHTGNALLGTLLDGRLTITDQLDRGLEGVDCLIDFTQPAGTLAHLAACQAKGVAMVIGTTGFDAAGKAAISEAAKQIPIVFAANMSVGVNATFKLLELAAKALSTGYDIEVLEMHHRHKVDAPSGTALAMGEVIAEAQGTSLAERAIRSRDGHTGARERSSIGFATLRGGDVIGDHTVIFAGEGERIEISHKASSRAGYASGALRAARYLADKKCGLFDMHDVLGFRG